MKAILQIVYNSTITIIFIALFHFFQYGAISLFVNIPLLCNINFFLNTDCYLTNSKGSLKQIHQGETIFIEEACDTYKCDRGKFIKNKLRKSKFLRQFFWSTMK